MTETATLRTLPTHNVVRSLLIAMSVRWVDSGPVSQPGRLLVFFLTPAVLLWVDYCSQVEHALGLRRD